MKNPILVLLIVFLSSCDYFVTSSGKVLDGQTKEPLSQVQVNLIIDNNDNGAALEYQFDTVSVEVRDSINKVLGTSKDWKKQGWYVSIPSIQEGKYARHVPLKTDSAGYFDVFLHTGYYSSYKLKFSKAGYENKILTDDELKELAKQFADTIQIKLKKN